jgi:hypothetical protein
MANNAEGGLIGFMTEMNQWEVEFCSAQDAADDEDEDVVPLKQEYKKKLEVILNLYSLNHGLNRDRLNDLGATIPPAYQPTNDQLEADSSGTIFMVQQSNGFKTKSRFFMVERGGTWLIDKKERAEVGDKWVSSSL